MATGDGSSNDIDEDLHSWQLAVYGRETMRRLFGANVLISGMNGLGAEIAKNLILAGVKSLTLRDDVIEKSNLSRQSLFSDWNIGQAKPTVAASAASSINPNLHIEALQNRMSPETGSVFNDAFWENLNVIVNALDNVNARIYMDQKCLYFQKPLLESGTLGAKYNTQDGYSPFDEELWCLKGPTRK